MPVLFISYFAFILFQLNDRIALTRKMSEEKEEKNKHHNNNNNSNNNNNNKKTSFIEHTRILTHVQ